MYSTWIRYLIALLYFVPYLLPIASLLIINFTGFTVSLFKVFELILYKSLMLRSSSRSSSASSDVSSLSMFPHLNTALTTVNRFQGRQRRVYGESLLPVSRVEFFRLALHYFILFDNVWNEHCQSDTWGTYPPTCPRLRWCIWSPSRMECIYRRKCLIFRFTISSCSQGVHVPRVSMMSIKVQPHKRYEYILLKEWWSVSRLKSFVFRFKIWSSSL